MAYPDAVAILAAYLDSLHTVPVVTRVPSPRPAEFIQIRQVGGAELIPVRDVARLDVFYWAATEPAAKAGGMTVRGQIHALRGTTQSGVQIYRVEETLQRQTDDPLLTNAPGWWATYALTMRANDVVP